VLFDELLKCEPCQILPVAGAPIIPKIGLESSIKAIFTVKSFDLLMNSFVPSNGSTNQYGISVLIKSFS
jgi:hypothetical protein